MARNSKDPSISIRNDASCINNKRGMARRAKRNSNKRDRQLLRADLAVQVEEQMDILDRLVEQGHIEKYVFDCTTNKEWNSESLTLHFPGGLTLRVEACAEGLGDSADGVLFVEEG